MIYHNLPLPCIVASSRPPFVLPHGCVQVREPLRDLGDMQRSGLLDAPHTKRFNTDLGQLVIPAYIPPSGVAGYELRDLSAGQHYEAARIQLAFYKWSGTRTSAPVVLVVDTSGADERPECITYANIGSQPPQFYGCQPFDTKSWRIPSLIRADTTQRFLVAAALFVVEPIMEPAKRLSICEEARDLVSTDRLQEWPGDDALRQWPRIEALISTTRVGCNGHILAVPSRTASCTKLLDEWQARTANATGHTGRMIIDDRLGWQEEAAEAGKSDLGWRGPVPDSWLVDRVPPSPPCLQEIIFPPPPAPALPPPPSPQSPPPPTPPPFPRPPPPEMPQPPSAPPSPTPAVPPFPSCPPSLPNPPCPPPRHPLPQFPQFEHTALHEIIPGTKLSSSALHMLSISSMVALAWTILLLCLRRMTSLRVSANQNHKAGEPLSKPAATDKGIAPALHDAHSKLPRKKKQMKKSAMHRLPSRDLDAESDSLDARGSRRCVCAPEPETVACETAHTELSDMQATVSAAEADLDKMLDAIIEKHSSGLPPAPADSAC